MARMWQLWQQGSWFAVGLMVAVFVACSSPAITEIRIGAIAPLTGDVATTSGQPTLDGITLAIQQVNAQGGIPIDGTLYPITLVTADDQDNPNQAVAAANRLINQENIIALVGVPLSRIATPVASVAEQAQVPMVSSKSTNLDTTAGKLYSFRATFTDTFQGQVLATFAAHELNLQRAAILYDVASNYNQDLAKIFTAAFTARGGKIVASESYVTGENNFQAQLKTIRAADPEVLFLPNYPAEVILQAQQARELGIEAVLIGGDAWSGLAEVSEPSLAGAYYTSDWVLDLGTPASQAFVAAYQAEYQRLPTSAAALGYDAVQLVIEAIRAADSLDPVKIRDRLAAIQYVGVTGTIKFSRTGDPIKGAAIIRIDGGDRVFDRLVTPD
ncbi:ABC transporter substrate-binding protein [Spirulina major]|uniref:ABC transporter substrate-binding protein n=1 Tax=Spirulina major TaxID=270636 RepID=UPI000A03914D|nr:ABC transporter substrate-binding protein [Spirulina major]